MKKYTVILTTMIGLAVALPVFADDANVATLTSTSASTEATSTTGASVKATRPLVSESTDKLKGVKDKKKKDIVEKAVVKIQDINTRQLAHFEDVLKQIESVLAKVETRIEKASARGLDVSTVQTNVENTEAAIAAARAAILVQQGKVYTITVTDETTLKGNLRETVKALKSDLETVRNLVKAAREALRVTTVSLAQVSHINATATTTTDTTTAAATTSN